MVVINGCFCQWWSHVEIVCDVIAVAMVVVFVRVTMVTVSMAVSVTVPACLYSRESLQLVGELVRCSERLRLVPRPKLIARTISERLSVALCCCSGNSAAPAVT